MRLRCNAARSCRYRSPGFSSIRMHPRHRPWTYRNYVVLAVRNQPLDLFDHLQDERIRSSPEADHHGFGIFSQQQNQSLVGARDTHSTPCALSVSEGAFQGTVPLLAPFAHSPFASAMISIAPAPLWPKLHVAGVQALCGCSTVRRACSAIACLPAASARRSQIAPAKSAVLERISASLAIHQSQSGATDGSRDHGPAARHRLHHLNIGSGRDRQRDRHHRGLRRTAGAGPPRTHGPECGNRDRADTRYA